MVIFDNLVHFSKALIPIYVIELGMFIDCSWVQFLNTSSLRESIVLGMFIDVNILQFWKADPPIEEIEVGMETDVSVLQLLNECISIEVTM